MLFSSIVFLFTFLPAVLVLYYLLPERFHNPVLLLASLIFYAWGEPVYIFLMLLSILFNYFSGLDIARNLTDRRLAKRSLIFNIVVNIAILGFFKYEGFVLDSLNAVLPVHITYHPLALPIGISFYTFQILSYIIDVYRGNVKVQKNILNFALYVTMFPQLIAGPIVQYADVEEQLVNRKSSWNKFGEGCMYFIRGLAKKVLLANTSGMIFTEVTGLGKGNVSVLSAWLGAFAYMFQIYFDFSGYSDMAVGLGKMFGFEFCMNFNYPYIAKSITEFWRRWHITLGTWMKDYIFYPFSISKKMLAFGKKAKKIFGKKTGKILPICAANLLIFFVVGVWHGAAWKYIIYGLYNGLIIAASNLLKPYYAKWAAVCHVNTESRGWKTFQIFRTFILVNIGWLFDACATATTAFYAMRAVFINFKISILTDGSLYKLGLVKRDWTILIVATIILFISSVMKEKGMSLRDFVAERPLVVRWAVYLILIFATAPFGYVSSSTEFMYAQF